jgi:hypothetical protein
MKAFRVIFAEAEDSNRYRRKREIPTQILLPKERLKVEWCR